MQGKRTTSSRLRLMIILAMTSSILLFGQAMMYLHSSFIDGRKQTAQHVVEVAHKVLESSYALEASGKLSRAEAQNASLTAIRSLRYAGGVFLDQRHAAGDGDASEPA